jgi:hypothetical protein
MEESVGQSSEGRPEQQIDFADERGARQLISEIDFAT